jgi:hypothetical protein
MGTLPNGSAKLQAARTGLRDGKELTSADKSLVMRLTTHHPSAKRRGERSTLLLLPIGTALA